MEREHGSRGKGKVWLSSLQGRETLQFSNSRLKEGEYIQLPEFRGTCNTFRLNTPLMMQKGGKLCLLTKVETKIWVRQHGCPT